MQCSYDPELVVSQAQLDADLLAIAIENGTLDLKAMTVRPSRREDYITRLAPVRFDPDAPCPEWEKFLEEILPDPELRAFVQRAVGYSMTGITSEHALFLLYGMGANGKSTFLEVLRFILGDYSSTADFNTFLSRKGQSIRNDIARLRGVRFVTAIESEKGKRLDEGIVKVLTGGDTVAARFLFKEHFEFQPRFKLWLSTNHRPRVVGTDLAIWRRIRLVPFTVTIPPERRDQQLAEKLKLEKSGIFNWALAGCREWLAHGLQEPTAVLAATEEYRESQDVIGAFLDAKCRMVPDGQIGRGELYKVYKNWCDESGEYRLTDREFNAALEERGLKPGRTKAVRYWQGLTLDSEFQF
jgi:putative DNA primase/helicase